MQMLKAGGLRVPGQHPYHEPGPVECDRGGKWLEKVDAAKWLNPSLQGAPDQRYRRRCLWLSRDEEEQARSWVKWSKATTGPVQLPDPEAGAMTVEHIATRTIPRPLFAQQGSC